MRSSQVVFPFSGCSQELHHALKQAQDDLDEQDRELSEKREALQRLKQASSEKEAELLSEVKRLKERAARDKAELERALEKAVEKAGEAAPTDIWNAKIQPDGEFLSCPLVRCSRGRRRWTTGPAWSCRKQTLASERGWPAWYITHTHTGEGLTHFPVPNKGWELTNDT